MKTRKTRKKRQKRRGVEVNPEAVRILRTPNEREGFHFYEGVGRPTEANARSRSDFLEKTDSANLKILDVGCGSAELRFLSGQNVFHADISKTADHLELVSDVYHLPFRDNSFPVVHASALLEHLEQPLTALQEMKRVSSNFIIIKVPNAVHGRASRDGPEHIFSWNFSTFSNLLDRVFPYVRVLTYQEILPVWPKKQSKLMTAKMLLLSVCFRNKMLTAICSCTCKARQHFYPW